jgi:hypothetical protein
MPIAKPTSWNWTAISVFLGALSIAGSSIFSGLQIHAAEQAERSSRLTSELAVLTQLQGTFSHAYYGRVPYGKQYVELKGGRRDGVSVSAERAVGEEASVMDFFAWLFDHGHVTAPGAVRLWGPTMICEYQNAFAPVFREPAVDVPNLVEFIQRYGRALEHFESC